MDIASYVNTYNMPAVPVKPRRPNLVPALTSSSAEGIKLHLERVAIYQQECQAYAEAVKSYDAAMVAYRECNRMWNQHEVDMVAKFRRDAEAELGILTNPKKDLLWTKAWEQGHSGGLYDVWNALVNLVDLIL